MQNTGVYVGNSTISCQRTKASFYLIVEGPGVYIWFHVYANIDRGVGITTKNVSWESGFNNQSRPVVSMNGQTVSYSKKLFGDHLKLEGKMRHLVFDIEMGEPRLCPLTSMSGACSVMS